MCSFEASSKVLEVISSPLAMTEVPQRGLDVAQLCDTDLVPAVAVPASARLCCTFLRSAISPQHMLPLFIAPVACDWPRLY